MLKYLLLLLGLSVVKSQYERDKWDDVDYEIFDLNDSLQKLIGKDTTFYDFLQVDSIADTKAISSAYRKVSLKYHPDKNDSQDLEIYAKLLTSIATILKDVESRSKYDQHLKKGFPIWRGSGYYYKKYRPGLISVLIIVVIFISNVQYWSGWGIYLLGKYIESQESSTPEASGRAKGKKKEAVSLVRKRELKMPKVTDVLLFQIPWLMVGLVKSMFRGRDKGVKSN